MNKIVFRNQDLLDYESIVMVWNNKGKKYLGHTFIYNGRKSKYLLFLYKDEMPNKKFLDAWNWLDDNSFAITIVSEPTLEQAIDDFLAVWEPKLIEEAFEIIEVEGFDDIEQLLESQELINQSMLLFARKQRG